MRRSPSEHREAALLLPELRMDESVFAQSGQQSVAPSLSERVQMSIQSVSRLVSIHWSFYAPSALR